MHWHLACMSIKLVALLCHLIRNMSFHLQEISKLRYELCPRVMKERKFWRIYFILVNSHVSPWVLFLRHASIFVLLEKGILIAFVLWICLFFGLTQECSEAFITSDSECCCLIASFMLFTSPPPASRPLSPLDSPIYVCPLIPFIVVCYGETFTCIETFFIVFTRSFYIQNYEHASCCALSCFQFLKLGHGDLYSFWLCLYLFVAVVSITILLFSFLLKGACVCSCAVVLVQ